MSLLGAPERYYLFNSVEIRGKVHIWNMLDTTSVGREDQLLTAFIYRNSSIGVNKKRKPTKDHKVKGISNCEG